VPALTKVTVVDAIVQILAVADVVVTDNPELDVGETEKVPLPKTLVPGFVKVIL